MEDMQEIKKDLDFLMDERQKSEDRETFQRFYDYLNHRKDLTRSKAFKIKMLCGNHLFGECDYDEHGQYPPPDATYVGAGYFSLMAIINRFKSASLPPAPQEPLHFITPTIYDMDEMTPETHDYLVKLENYKIQCMQLELDLKKAVYIDGILATHLDDLFDQTGKLK